MSCFESAIRHDYDLVILGWGVKWEGLSQKLEAAQNYAASIDANDIMLFTDAFDVLYLERPIVVQNEFQKMNADIVFSGECGCWPHVMENRVRFAWMATQRLLPLTATSIAGLG